MTCPFFYNLRSLIIASSHWHGSPPVATPPKKNDFPSPVTIAVSSYSARASVPWASLIHTGMLIGLSPCRSCPGDQGCNQFLSSVKFICTQVTCLEDIFCSLPVPPHPASSNILYVFCSSVFPEPWNGYQDVLFRAEHQWFILSTLANPESLC